MLFMTVYTYKAAKRDAIIKRRLEKGPLVPEGLKILGEWSYIASGKVFRLVDAPDAASMFKASYAWSDLGIIEAYPVLETEAVMAAIGKK